jgi:nickel-dependent lactate racemase
MIERPGTGLAGHFQEGSAAGKESGMRVSVSFQNERLDMDVPDDRLIGQWQGPAHRPETDAEALVLDALEHPSDYPPLRQAVVPGDQVVIAFDDRLPEPRPVLAAIFHVLKRSGVEPDGATVLVGPQGDDGLTEVLPAGASLVVHEPGERTQLAYLASTKEGRRVYLNRRLTDADFVLPVGRLGYDPVLGYAGPWGLIFPGLSDRDTMTDFRSRASDDLPEPDRPRPALTESAEVSWLLGSQCQLAVMGDESGLAGAFAGLPSAVQEVGARALDRAWSFQAESRAEAVVVGIGRPGSPTRLEDLAGGLATATRLVRRGGKIVALSRASGTLGPALQRLVAADDPRNAPAALRGHEADPDFTAARQVARAVAWADVYLLSALGQDHVEDLSIVALDRPEEARRLVASASSCVVVSRADLTRASVAGERD